MRNRAAIINKFKRLIVSIVVASSMACILTALPVVDSFSETGVFSNTSVYAADERRPPPSSRQAQTLGQRVFRQIEDVVELMDVDDYDGAREALGDVRDMFDRGRLSDYEQYTMWLFYASIDQSQERYRDAANAYQEILKLPKLTPVQLEQALVSLGALFFVQEEYRQAIDTFVRYLEVAFEPSPDIYLRIGTAHYQLDEFNEAIPYLLSNMQGVRARGNGVPVSTYSLLRALYLTVEDYISGKQIQREMLVLFNDPDDWAFLASILAQLEEYNEQLRTYYSANAMGYLDTENKLMNLASQLYNNDNPYQAGVVVEKGIADGIIEEDESNLSFLAQFWQFSREDQRAVAPLVKAAEMSEDGEKYARLARLYLTMSEFENAIDAFDSAFEKGDLNRADQTHIAQARAYMELNRYDEAIEAANSASEDERSEATAATWITVLQNAKARYDSIEEQRIEYKDYF